MGLDKSKLKRGCKSIELVGLTDAHVRTIDGNERDTLMQWHEDFKAAKDDELKAASILFQHRCVSMYLSDKNAMRMISDAEINDVNSLALPDVRMIIKEGEAYNFALLDDTKKN